MSDKRFLDFCEACTRAATDLDEPAHILERIASSMRELLIDWRIGDARYCQVQPGASYGSYLLFKDERSSLTIVQDVFAPGQAAIIHNHGIWGVFGCIQGKELETLYRVLPDLSQPPQKILSRPLVSGTVHTTDPEGSEFHQVECDGPVPSISLHVYGADIGTLRRTMWDAQARRYTEFSSGYSNESSGLGQYLFDR